MSGHLIDEVRDFHGPEDSGAEVSYNTTSGKIWKVTIALNERYRDPERKWGTRVMVVVQHISRRSDEAEPQLVPIWFFDFTVNYKNRSRCFTFRSHSRTANSSVTMSC
jgi:hypothetical protein